MAADSDSGEEPTRPVIFDHKVGWSGNAGMEEQQLSALRHVQANDAARQAAAHPAIVPQLPQQTGGQPGEGGVAANPEPPVPQPNTGLGQERPQGTYDKLKAAPDLAAGAEKVADAVLGGVAKAFETVADAFESLLGGGPSTPVQEKQPAPQQEPPAMTAKERHEARVQAFIEADNQQRQEKAKAIGASASLTDDQLRQAKEEQEKLNQGKGGGISL